MLKAQKLGTSTSKTYCDRQTLMCRVYTGSCASLIPNEKDFCYSHLFFKINPLFYYQGLSLYMLKNKWYLTTSCSEWPRSKWSKWNQTKWGDFLISLHKIRLLTTTYTVWARRDNYINMGRGAQFQAVFPGRHSQCSTHAQQVPGKKKKKSKTISYCMRRVWLMDGFGRWQKL